MMRGFVLLAFAGQLAAQLPRTVTDPAKPGKGIIEGAVLNQITAEPIKKADVRLGGAGPALIAVTDASGRFTFRGLPAGVYWLTAAAEEYSAPDTETGVQITLAADEHQAGIELPLVAQASISGRVRDEYEAPVSDCGISAMHYEYQQGERRLWSRAGASTNDKGEYRIPGLLQGRYYVFLRCQAQLPAPHPLLPRGDPRVPHQTYAPQFYPGVPDLTGATKVAVTPGSALKGIDFRVRRIGGFTVRGHVTGAEGGWPPEGIQVTLHPQSDAVRDAFSYSAAVNRETRRFEILAVPSGSYLLVATAFGPAYYAMLPVEVSDVPPEPTEVSLLAGREVGGTLETESESTPEDGQSARVSPNPPEKAKIQISLSPVGGTYLLQQAQCTVNDDGTFRLAGVLPGRWRLNLIDAPGYVKAFTIGDREVSPYAFEIGTEPGQDWRIVLSNKTAQVDVSISDALPAGGRAVSVLLAPDNPSYFGAGLEVTGNPDEKGRVTLGVRPGRYRAYALETRDAWRVLQRPNVLHTLERRSEIVDVEGEGRAQVTLGLVRADELKRALEENE